MPRPDSTARAPVYISAPAYAAHPYLRRWQVARSTTLALLVIAEHGVPVGYADQMDTSGIDGGNGLLDDAIRRSCNQSLIRLCSLHTCGRYYELLTDDGERTSAMRRDWMVWGSHQPRTLQTTSHTWEHWGPRLKAAGMEAAWVAFSEEPTWSEPVVLGPETAPGSRRREESEDDFDRYRHALPIMGAADRPREGYIASTPINAIHATTARDSWLRDVWSRFWPAE